MAGYFQLDWDLNNLFNSGVCGFYYCEDMQEITIVRKNVAFENSDYSFIHLPYALPIIC